MDTGIPSFARHTQRLRADVAGIATAAELLRAGRLVAFPTETVYGLGAHALDPAAVADVFVAKGRPAEDPLIVHISSMERLSLVARDVPIMATRLIDRFWPGPLTLVLHKMSAVPNSVTAGRPTVAVRVPAHPLALALLEAADQPIAAPSANSFSRPSPTRAEHVLEDLDGRIDAILDGGPTRLGLESTIVDMTGPRPRLLRPGGIPREEVEATLGEALVYEEYMEVTSTRLPEPMMAPGMLAKHYSPRTPLIMIAGVNARERLRGAVGEAVAAGKRVGVLALREDRGQFPVGATVREVGTWNEAEAIARRLFDELRHLDRLNMDVLFVRELTDPRSGLGWAVADRLKRAASETRS